MELPQSFLVREFARLCVLQVLTSNNYNSDADTTMKFAGIIEPVLLMCYWT